MLRVSLRGERMGDLDQAIGPKVMCWSGPRQRRAVVAAAASRLLACAEREFHREIEQWTIVNSQEVGMDMHRYGRLALGALCMSLCMAFQADLCAREKGGAQRAQNSQSLDSMLSAHLQQLILHDVLQAKKGGHVSVRANPRTGLVVVELSREFVPEHDPAENEDFEGKLSEEIQYLLDSAFVVREVRFLYGGRAIQTYFPALDARNPVTSSAGSAFAGGR